MPQRGLSRIELLQGPLDLIILQTLRWGPRHGYGLAQMIRADSGDLLQVDTGSLYPALIRLERRGATREPRAGAGLPAHRGGPPAARRGAVEMGADRGGHGGTHGQAEGVRG